MFAINRPTILILGTDHFDNPDNGDMIMTKTEAVLSDKREKEFSCVVDMLKKFKPTKIALEVLSENQDRLNKEYKSYQAGNFNLTSNERHQIGFRLAKIINLDEISAVDWNEKVEGVPNVGAWSNDNKNEIFDEIVKLGQQWKGESEKYFQNHTIKAYLLWLNDPKNIRANHEIYMKLALIGTKSYPVGAMWTVQYWYYRNMIIYKNLVELISSEEERIFVLYGAGHLHILIQFLQDSGLFNVELPSKYLSTV